MKLLIATMVTIMIVLLVSCFNGGGLSFNSFVGNSGGNSGGTILGAFPKVFYGDSSYDIFYTIFSTSNGGIILSGYQQGSGVDDALFIKINSQGQTLWKKLGSIGKQSFSFFELGEYYYSAGITYLNGDKNYITKLNPDGSTNTILYFDFVGYIGNLLPIDNDSLIFLSNNEIAKIDTNLQESSSVKWVAEMNGNIITYNNLVVSAFPYHSEGNKYVFFIAQNSSGENKICKMNVSSDSITDFDSVSTVKKINGLPYLKSICPGFNDDIIILGLDNSDKVLVAKADKDLNNINVQKLYNHNFDLENFNFHTGLILPGLGNKYLLVINGNSPDGSLVVLLNNDLTISRKVLLNMRVMSALPYGGGYVFAGKLNNTYDAVVMSLDSNLNPVGCNTVVNTSTPFTFEEDSGSPAVTLEDSTLNFVPDSISGLHNDNTATTDANLTEDTTCRTNWN
ncbi:MAG: hypothetical protein N2169_04870 [bacterium]|nr:hypothetical protein [bacterium]